LSCEGQFLKELIAFASTSLDAAKVRAAAISIPGFADQERYKKIKREDYKSHSVSFKREHFMGGFGANSIRL